MFTIWCTKNMKWLHKIIYSFLKENDKQEKMDEAQDKFSLCKLALSLVKWLSNYHSQIWVVLIVLRLRTLWDLMERDKLYMIK